MQLREMNNKKIGNRKGWKEVRGANRRTEEEQEDDLPLSFDGSNTYIEVPTDGEWHRIAFTSEGNETNELSINGEIIMYNRTLDEDEVREAYLAARGGFADRVLSAKEIAVVHELLSNHPEIKDWWIKNNVLYLKVVDEKN